MAYSEIFTADVENAKGYFGGLFGWTCKAMTPTDFPEIGRCAYVKDGQDTIVGMITPAGEY